jgi:putative ABC transport system permease protein
MYIRDTFLMALRTLQHNKLRSGITIAIIAFGIMALIGIVTAIGAMNQKLTESFSTMGSNGFSLRFKERNLQIGSGKTELKRRRKENRISNSQSSPPITREEAEAFVRNFKYPATTGIATFAGNNFIVQYGTRKTNPNQYAVGGDENYTELNGFSILHGRNLTTEEVRRGADRCLLGFDVASKLFPDDPQHALNKTVRINSIPFVVVGVLAGRGSSFGFSRDALVIAGYRSVVRHFQPRSFTIGVMTADVRLVEEAMGEAEGLLRSIRKLNATTESNFVLERSNSVAEKAIAVLRYLTLAVVIIGFITLTGSAIGLMNIMLVSVTERTKEVGLMKAIGARRVSIRDQFLAEALLISVFGAIIGIIAGLFVGNLFSLLLHTRIVVPWNWVVYAVLLSTLVGIVAGMYPAMKAGRLNPIEALRYE